MPDGFGALHAAVYHTESGTPYLREAGAVLLARPQVDIGGLAGFLGGFGPGLGFEAYLEDPPVPQPGAQLCKVAGQTCYQSFGAKRTRNADAARYLTRILESGHGSVLEHAAYTLLLYGVSRSLTHELVRHRAGMAYCLDGATLIDAARADGGRPVAARRRIADLFSLQATPEGRSRIARLRLRCYDERTFAFTAGRLRRVAFSGLQPAFRVTLEDGRAVTCTRAHRFLTPSGWMTLDEAVGGLAVSWDGRATFSRLDVPLLTDDEAVSRRLVGSRPRRRIGRRATTAAWSGAPAGVRFAGRRGLRQPTGWWSRATAPRYPRCPADRPQAAEAAARPFRGIQGAQTLLPGARRLSRRTAGPGMPRPRSIIALEFVGVRATYDIEMEGENRNFVANGIVTHNSQVSQRYVGGPTLRFVERPEFAADPKLQRLFERRIDRAAAEYAELAERLRERRLTDPAFAALGRTDQRKAVQQTARALLPNETEAPIVVTGNVRAWRHVIAMRCDPHAEPEIRRAVHRAWRLLVAAEPLLFGDFTPEALPDGSEGLRSPFPKV